MTAPADRERRGERGVTLVELIIVLLIAAILGATAIMLMRSAQYTARANTMKTLATQVGRSVSSYNRMRPPIRSDALLAGTTWTSTQSEAAGGLYSLTGERLLDPWPEDPYSRRPVVVQRRATCPAAAAPGTVAVCRIAGASRNSFRVRAWARDRRGASYVVFDQVIN